MKGENDPFAHHVAAQQSGGAWTRAAAELRRGRKAGHWMWFVFPQLAGLGSSAMSRRFAIADLADARHYLGHAVLGPRLEAMVRLAMDAPSTDPVALLGPVDAMKLRSSLTLFDRAAGPVASGTEASPVRQALDALYGGIPCHRTLAMLDDAPACD